MGVEGAMHSSTTRSKRTTAKKSRKKSTHSKTRSQRGTAPKSHRKTTRRKQARGKHASATSQARTVSVNEHLTDMGNAKRFVRAHGKLVKYVPARGWFSWTGNHWKIDDSGEVMRLAKHIVTSISKETQSVSDDGERAERLRRFARRCENPARLKAMLELAQSEPGVAVNVDALDADAWKINCRNGTLDLRTGTLHSHNPDDLITKLLGVEYDPKAECPLFMAFLGRIFDGDGELIGFVQRILGHALTGSMKEQKFFVLFGRGANGKSVLIDIVLHVAGPYGKTAAPELFLKKTYANHPTELADLQGARVVVCPEVERDRAFNEGLLKQLTGGDRIKARYMRQDFFEFASTAKIIISANSLPDINGADHGIWRRVHIVPFDTTIPEEQQDKDLGHKLKAEAPGILAWMVRGCLTWQQEGLRPPPRVVQATGAYRERMDIVGRFLADVCERVRDARVPAADLFAAFEKWCRENSELLLTQKEFGTRLEDHEIPGKKSNGRMVRLGLRLKRGSPREDRE